MYARFANRYHGGITIIILSSIMLNILVFAGSIYMLIIYDSVLPSNSIQTLLGLFVMLVVLYIFQGAFQIIRSRALLTIGNSLHADLSPAINYAVVNRPLKSGSGEGDGMQPLRDLDQIYGFMIGNGPVAFIDLPWVVAFLLVLFLLHFWLGVTALFGIAVLAALAFWTNRSTRAGTQDLAQIAARRNGAADTAIRYGEASVAMGMQPQIMARSHHWNMQYLAAQSRMALTVAELGGSGRLFRIFLQSMMLTVGALLVIDGKASGGIILASSVLVGRALAPVDQAIASWRSFVSARAGWTRLTKLLAAHHPPMEPSVILLTGPHRVVRAIC